MELKRPRCRRPPYRDKIFLKGASGSFGWVLLEKPVRLPDISTKISGALRAFAQQMEGYGSRYTLAGRPRRTRSQRE